MQTGWPGCCTANGATRTGATLSSSALIQARSATQTGWLGRWGLFPSPWAAAGFSWPVSTTPAAAAGWGLQAASYRQHAGMASWDRGQFVQLRIWQWLPACNKLRPTWAPVPAVCRLAATARAGAGRCCGARHSSGCQPVRPAEGVRSVCRHHRCAPTCSSMAQPCCWSQFWLCSAPKLARLAAGSCGGLLGAAHQLLLLPPPLGSLA